MRGDGGKDATPAPRTDLSSEAMAGAAARFPIAALTIAAVMTVAACVWLVWAAWGSYRLAVTTRDRHSEGERLAGLVTYLDEVLTMSTQMAVATGNPTWRARYDEFEPKLAAAIGQAIALDDRGAGGDAARRTAAANVGMVAAERRALGLTVAGRADEARAILDGAEYARFKEAYAASVATLVSHLRQQLDRSLEDVRRLTLGAIVAALFVSAVALFAWASVARRLRAWSAALDAGAAERRRLEEQFRQAQKMEAIGRLAGGVAHDFNNILTVIMGFGDRLLKHLPDGSAAREDAEEIGTAARRAAVLTRQLLTFTRRQVVEPIVLDVGGVVGAMEGMLRRLLGEDLELSLALDPTARPILIDRGQMEQVVMNLAINARDAMPDGGKLVITVGRTSPDEVRSAERVTGAPAGRDWITMSVADTGHGMDSEVRSHLFEPFFTTKRVGRGTGLGLATVYAVVQQGGGSITITSHPGRGTDVRIHLPCVEPAAEAVAAHEAKRRSDGAADAPAPHTVVLLVEDETPVRELARRILTEAGYIVLAAPGGAEALRQAEQHEGPIALLATDVVMPGMSGRELGERLRAIRPDMRVLYLSGYTADVQVDAGAPGAGPGFLPKPFTHDALLDAVRRLVQEP